MKKIKINMDRKPLSSEEIAAGKDFNGLLAQYNSTLPKPWYTSIKVWLGSASVLVATVVLVMYFNHATGVTNTQPVANTPFIDPPIAGAQVQFVDYVVDADRDTSIKYATGSRLTIPAGAFLYTDGRVATGKVQIKYREFHDAVDILLSGITMYYDTVGDIDHLQSAGMIQFVASQDGKELKPNPDKLININMASNNADSSYNLYYLDTMQRKWVISNQAMKIATPVEQVAVRDTITTADTTAMFGYTTQQDGGRDTGALPSPTNNPQLQQVQTEIVKIEQTKPLEPKQADEGKQSFNIDVDPKEFPEIAVYKKVLFELEGDQKMDPKWFDTVWEGVTLQENQKGKNYWVTFTKGSQKIKLLVHPVFDGDDYKAANKVYQQKYAEYQKILKDSKEKEAKLLAEQKKRDAEQRKANLALARQQQKDYEAQSKANLAYQKQQWQANQSRFAAEQAVYGSVTRSFTLNNFGVVNCDQTLKLVNRVVLEPKYLKATGGYLNDNYSAFLVLMNRNTVIANPTQSIFFPGEPCMMVVIDDEFKVWLAEPEQFKGITNNTTHYTFKMTEVSDKANIEKTLRQYLKPKVSS